jgi:hypothetical protein
VESYHTLLAATVVAPSHTKGRPAVSRVHRAAGRRRKAGLRTQCRQALARQARRQAAPVASVASVASVYLGDDLFACEPIVSMLADAGDDFIFTCKESSHKALYDFIDGLEPERHVETIRKGKAVETRRYRWIVGVPLRDGKRAALVNWIAFEIFDRHPRHRQVFHRWVTSLPVSKANVAEIAAAGRARWKIENETFNVMKNHGYEFEHNFGHGETFLAMTLAALNLLAFAWHWRSISSSRPGRWPAKPRRSDRACSPTS